MQTNKPTILIYGVSPNSTILKEIAAGIEEEGVLYDIVYQNNMSLDSLCFESSNTSVLGAGIGIYGTHIALSLRLLEKGTYLFELKQPSGSQARKLGSNAARAVKRIPFLEL
jgi:hypothetical protein